MNITVIGCGRWGSFIAWYLHKAGHSVCLYGREGSPHMKQFRESRTNGIVEIYGAEDEKLRAGLYYVGADETLYVDLSGMGSGRYKMNNYIKTTTKTVAGNPCKQGLFSVQMSTHQLCFLRRS